MIKKFFANLSPRGKMIFNIALICFVLLLIDRLFLGPFMEKSASIDDDIRAEKNRVMNEMNILKHKTVITKNSEQYGRYFIKDVKDDDVINAEFLSIVEKLASQAKVSLVKSNPTESVKNDNAYEYYANLDCEGPLENVVSFMHSVNSTDDLLKIVRFQMTPKRGSANDVNASMTVSKLIVRTP